MHWTDSAAVYHPREPKSSPLWHLLYQLPHRQYVFSIPIILRKFFKYDQKLLGKLCQCVNLARDDEKGREALAQYIIRNPFSVKKITYPKCGSEMKIISFINEAEVIRKILEHLEVWEDKKLPTERAPPVISNVRRYDPDTDGLPHYEEPSNTVH